MTSISNLSGGIKILYDLMLYRNLKALKPPEEKAI
jgi:hypothetical protein